MVAKNEERGGRREGKGRERGELVGMSGRGRRKEIDEQVWKYIMSPSEPSVSAGEKTGILFYKYHLGKQGRSTSTGRTKRETESPTF